MEHALARAVAGDQVIANESALPRGWAANRPGEIPDEQYAIDRMNVYAIDPSTPRLHSVVAPQPEGLPGPGRPAVYSGGGPQVQMPFGTIPKGTDPVASFRVYQPGRGDRVLNSWVGPVDDAGDAASLGSLVTDQAQPGPPPRAVPGAVLPAPAAGEAPHTRERVEPVNPDYERPPGTPEQLARMRREIGVLLLSRQQADADAGAAQADRVETGRRAEQLGAVAGGVDTLGQRTDTQRGEVAATAQANQDQQGRQAEAGSAIGASASRLAGLVTLELLLGGWAAVAAKFGAIISPFSDNGAAKMAELTDDAVRFMGQLARAKMLVSGQHEQQPMQLGRLSGDASAIGSESTRTDATGTGVDRSRQQVAALGGQNAEDAAAAADAEQRARRDAADADSAAADARARHDQLAADLEAWAQRHAEQRRLAIAQTVDRLQAEGYEVTDVPTA
jgi:hypothetical protein